MSLLYRLDLHQAISRKLSKVYIIYIHTYMKYLVGLNRMSRQGLLR